MRRKIAAGNWKMNTTVSEGKAFVEELSMENLPSDVDVILCVPATHLSALHGDDALAIGAQNMYCEDKGAFTGEISPLMLKDLGVKYVLVGHSERREIFCETDNLLASKLSKALEHGLTPIFCCGEPLDIRKKGTHVEYVEEQLNSSLFHLSNEEMNKIIVAYEPIWAIGTGETATPDQAQEMHAAIRSSLAKKYDNELADGIAILYGGSVKPKNAAEIFAKPDVDGGLVGGASLSAKGFAQIANSF